MSSQRLNELRMVDPVLSTIAQNYTSEMFLSEKIFPIISVNKMKGKYPVFGKDAFVLHNTARAIRADSNRVNSTGYTLETYETQEHDIEMALDYLESGEAADIARYEQKITKDLRDALALNREREIAECLQNTANYEQNQLTATTSEDLTIDVIKTGIEAMRSNIGRRPNTMILSNSLLEILLSAENAVPSVENQGMILPIIDTLKARLRLENIVVPDAVYSPDGSGLSDLWGDNILLLYVDNEKYSNEYNPSFGYIFQMSGMPEIDTYYENGGKVKVIRCTDNFCWKITAPSAAYLITTQE
ncbi:MAG: hypothetical protein PHV24_01885 [Candidatus Kapabacteria bacterium]|nr:hypothetical protein [Candidatus Kapabacteria bacterium]